MDSALNKRILQTFLNHAKAHYAAAQRKMYGEVIGPGETLSVYGSGFLQGRSENSKTVWQKKVEDWDQKSTAELLMDLNRLDWEPAQKLVWPKR